MMWKRSLAILHTFASPDVWYSTSPTGYSGSKGAFLSGKEHLPNSRTSNNGKPFGMSIVCLQVLARNMCVASRHHYAVVLSLLSFVTYTSAMLVSTS